MHETRSRFTFWRALTLGRKSTFGAKICLTDSTVLFMNFCPHVSREKVVRDPNPIPSRSEFINLGENIKIAIVVKSVKKLDKLAFDI